jgi:hypothetical protein
MLAEVAFLAAEVSEASVPGKSISLFFHTA